MTVTFDLRPEELDGALLRKIKSLVAGGQFRITIAVAPTTEDETTLLQRDPVLMQRIAALENGATQPVAFPLELLAEA